MMNNAVTELDGSDASIGQDEPVPAKLDVLHIDVASLTSHKGVRTVIEPLAGSPPTDYPIWVDHTASDVDVRGASPFSLRYVSNKERGFVVPLTGQGEIREAIWKRVREVVRDCDVMPAIIFDQRTVEGGVEGIIDLVFDSWRKIEKIEARMAQLDIQRPGEALKSYHHESTTNSLAGDIVVLECLRLPVESIDPKALLEAFTVMTAPVGTVMGIAELFTEFKTGKLRARNGVIRAYVKIPPANMTVPWLDLLLRLPNRFMWRGYPYTLLYPCHEWRRKAVFSANFPKETVQEVAGAKMVTSATKRVATAIDAEAPSSSSLKRTRTYTETKEARASLFGAFFGWS